MPLRTWKPQHRLPPLADRGPLRVLFVATSLPVGGAETLLVNLARRMDRSRFSPELCCLKELGPLGEELAREIPAHSRLLTNKYDVRVLERLTSLLTNRRIDALITVGAGDKMFWGRLAAHRARLPVVLSAIHSTGWPDQITWLNRRLTPLTDFFIAVAPAHGRHLIEKEGFPRDKVRIIPNGVDVARYRPRPEIRESVRKSLGVVSDAPVCGIVAALRPEKNHELFLHAAARVLRQRPDACFLVVGDGPRRGELERLARELAVDHAIRFLGSRSDVAEVLASMDVFALTSHNEANPVSILEAMATGLPVVATQVGSVAESVEHQVGGYLIPPGDVEAASLRWLELMNNAELRASMGEAGRRRVVEHGSLDAMVGGYQDLITQVYTTKSAFSPTARRGETPRREPHRVG